MLDLCPCMNFKELKKKEIKKEGKKSIKDRFNNDLGCLSVSSANRILQKTIQVAYLKNKKY